MSDFKQGDRVVLAEDWQLGPGQHGSWVARKGHRGVVLHTAVGLYPRVRLDVKSWDAISDTHIPSAKLRHIHELEVLADEARELGIGEAP